MDSPFSTPRKPRPGDVLEVHITELTPRGAGAAERVFPIGTPAKERVFRVQVQGAIPGDRGEARVRRVRRGVIDGTLDSLLEPSPLRTEAPCPHFRTPGDQHRACGGCTLQSLGHGDQLAQKVAMTRALLSEAGVGDARIKEPIALKEPWRYRNKMELSFGRDAEGRYALGMHPPGRKYDIVVLDDCHLMLPESAQWIAPIRSWAEEFGLEPFVRMDRPGFLRTLTIRDGFRTGQRMIELTTTGHATATTAHPSPSS